ncbi:MAG TPA: ion transporter [Candidatus Synoicihabitans sp.]|nr:ion transporter [Candidatus Synoicihabitans sp.]
MASGWRARWHEVVFEADTKAGKTFDLVLLIVILLSVLAVSLESVSELRTRYGGWLRLVEWIFTGLFTIEYVVRLLVVRQPLRYALSFYGLVDLCAILPTYLSLIAPGSQSLVVIRALRLLRVFRILKLTHFLGEARMLGAAVRASVRKIIVFLIVVLNLVLIAGASMYVIEGAAHGFTSIPISIYWAIVTMTTVGFGDIVPGTVAGRILASALMIMGYAIIAVPTGIVTVELGQAIRGARNTQACPSCGAEGHTDDARYCRICGARL